MPTCDHRSPELIATAAALVRARAEAPLQRRLRADAPAWIGAVLWTRDDLARDELLGELRRMRDTGFTFVRFHTIDPVELGPGRFDFAKADRWIDAAADAGLGVFPHVHLEKPTPQCLASVGLTPDEAKLLGACDPRVAQALRLRIGAIVGRYREHSAVWAWPMVGEPSGTGLALTTAVDRERFLAWLRERYATPADVHAAWAIYPRADADDALRVRSWDDALRIAATLKAPGALGKAIATTELPRHEVYGAARDLLRFCADRQVADWRAEVALVREHDDRRPICPGNHQLLLNHPMLGWDSLAAAGAGDLHYSSIHLSWHFDQVGGEVDRPVYFQARLTADAVKGGAAAAYETSGGPVQYSGGYGNHMDAGLMRRLMLSYLAGGCQAIAFWAWTARPGGIESGEYGLVTASGRISAWAQEAGRIAGAMQRHRGELWSAQGEPELGILRSWDTEAVMLMEPERFDLEDGPSAFARGPQAQHLRALVGAGRMATDARLDFEFVTEAEVLAGMAGRYPAILCPHLRFVSDAVLARLEEYVRGGGRLIADVQVGFADCWGKLRRQGPGTAVERIFGAWIDAVHDSRTGAQAVDGVAVDGFHGDLVASRARVLRRFADGRPALSECALGRGQAVLVAVDAARACWRAGNAGMQALLADCCRGAAAPRWSTDAPLAFRRTAPGVDHWFLLNDGGERSAVLRVHDRRYAAAADAVTGEAVAVDGTLAVRLPARSGVWLRCVHAQAR